MRFALPIALVVGAALCLMVRARADAPLRLANGEPLVCVYYFTHWWEPWKSNDDAIRADLRRLRAMGFNTILLDHEWSQAIDGNWRLLDRANRLAKECDMQVVPWLSPKTWQDITQGGRAQLAREWFGVDVVYGQTQDGKPAAPIIWHESVLTAGEKYGTMYLDRYLRDGPLLRVMWEGKLRPVVSLSVESAWDGSFDAATNARFRTWARRKYRSVARLNEAWDTALPSFEAIDPRDTLVFDYAGHLKRTARHPQAVEDHVDFRGRTISQTLSEIGRRVRRKHPDVLFMAEVPYQYDGVHPHARDYRIQYAGTPESVDWAEIVLVRCTGPITASEAAAHRRHQRRTGQKFVFTFRTYSDWDVQPGSQAFRQSVDVYPQQAARYGSGFGFYSFNEMVDTHVAWSAASAEDARAGWTQERSERAIGLLEAMVGRYRDIVGARKP